MNFREFGDVRTDINYKERRRVTGIILNDKDEIAMMNITYRHFHILPGGGIDEGEDKIKAIHREAKEETGADIEIISELGGAVEYLNDRQLKQITYYYLAKTIGEIGQPNFTENETSQGYKVEWHKLNDSVRTLDIENEVVSYTKQRELYGISLAKRVIEKRYMEFDI